MSTSPRNLFAALRTTQALSTCKAAPSTNVRLLNAPSIRSAMAVSNQSGTMIPTLFRQYCVPATSPDFSSLLAEFKSTAGKPITCKAAVAWEAKKPLDITDIQVAPPSKGEVRVKVIANALCHTDIYTLDGHDPEGLFPSVLGHEATAIVESVGESVTTVKPGDIVIPCYTPECKQQDCIFCASPKTNLCPKIRGTQGQGLMPDGTSRLSKDGKTIYHFMGCSTFAEYAVISEISAAKINPWSDLYKMCLLGCGVSTGWGAVFNTVKMEPGSSVAVFGLGALGLSVIQAAKVAGAKDIVGVDINEDKFELAKSMGATAGIKGGEGARKELMDRHKWGYDYTFDCTGNVNVMREALEVAHRGWGESCVIGVAAAGKEISTRPFQLVTGRQWKGTAFGGWKSRTEVPKLVQTVMRGEMTLDPYVTHTFEGIGGVNGAIEALHSGSCLRAVVNITPKTKIPEVGQMPKLKGNVKVEGGEMKQMSHFSQSLNCEMTFSVFLPPQAKDRMQKPPPVLFYLSGLTCTDENARTKANFAAEAAKLGLAVVFPDTSPRGVDIEGQDESYDFGSGAGFYVDATAEPWSRHYKMYSYVTKELPEYVRGLFPVDMNRVGICGHSMGGHGALICHLKNPGKYCSVSAFSPIANPTDCPWGEKAFKVGKVDYRLAR